MVKLQIDGVLGVVESLRFRARLDAAAGADQGGRRFREAREGAAGHGTEQRSAQRDRVLLADQMDLAAGGIGVFAQPVRVLGTATAHHDTLDLVSGGVHALDDVARAVGQSLQCREVQPGQRILALFQRESDDHAAGMRVGARRTVAVMVGQHVQVACRPLLARLQIGKPVVEHSVAIALLGLGGGFQQWPGIALAQCPVNQRAGGALPTFTEPPAGNHRAVIRPPNTGHHDRVRVDHHVAVRCTADDRQTAQGFRADQRQTAGVSVDDACRDNHTRGQSQFSSGPGAQFPGGGTERQNLRRNLAGDVRKAHGAEQRLAETVLVGQIIPFARERAHAGDIGIRQAPDEVIGKIEEAPRRGVTLREVLLEPQHLGQFHLDADLATDVGQGGVLGRVDRRSLRPGAVVHPHDDVVLRFARIGDGHRLAAGADRHQRAGRVDADRNDARRIDRRASHRLANGGAGLCPDIGGRLFNVQRFRMELFDRAHGEGQSLPVCVEQARTHTGRADIDAQKDLITHSRPRFLTC